MAIGPYLNPLARFYGGAAQTVAHQGVVGATVSGHQVTIPGDPCPWCSGKEYKIVSQEKFCAGCNLCHEDAVYRRENVARRDGNNSLLCQGCEQPFPYAEPDRNGRFRCFGCKLSETLE